MLKQLFTAIGGGIKDIQVAVIDTAEYVYDEVSSIPDALSDGYNKGLITAEEETEEPLESDGVTSVPATEFKKTFPANNS